MANPADYESGQIAARIMTRIFMFVSLRDLGEVVAEDRDSILSLGIADLIVDVRSRKEDQSALDKAVYWIGMGTRMAVVIDAEHREIVVIEAGGTPRILTMDDHLRLEPAIEGFVLQVREVFG